MKLLLPKILFKFILFVSLFVGQFAIGQTVIFTYPGGGALPTGWTAQNNVTAEPIDKGSYYLLEPGPTSDNIITNTIDLSSYASAELKVAITSFGSGAYTGLKAEIAYDGINYSETKTTTVTTGSYSTKTIVLGAVSSQVKIRLSVNATSGRGIRMQNLVLNGIGVGNAAPIVTGGTVSGSYGTAITPYQIIASGTPTSYAVATGTLPAGLSLDSTTGVITGIPTVVGSSSVTVTATNANGTSPAATLNFVIAPKSVTISGLTGSNKIYDGSLSATVTGTPTLNGVLPADVSNVTISGAGSYAFSNANVGVSKPIVVTGLTLSGSAAGKYTLIQPSDLSAGITAKTVTVSGVVAQNKVYDGTVAASISGGTLTGVIASDAANVSISTVGTFATANVGSVIAVTVTLTGSAATNYALTQPSVAADITKANQTITFNALPSLNQASTPIDLNTFATASSGLALTYVSSNPLVVSISGNTLTVVGLGTATITASQSGNGNYNAATNATQSITVSTVPEVIAQFDFTPYTLPAAVIVTTKNNNVAVSNFALSAGNITAGSTSGNEFPNKPMVEGQGGGWTSTTQAGAKNFNFNVTANPGYEIEVTSFQFNALATAAGPSAFSFDIATGIASYTVNAPNGNLVSVNEAVTGLTNLMSVQVLLQGWLNGSRPSTGAGVFRIDDVVLKGYVTCKKPIAYLVTGVENSCGTSAVVTLSDSEIGMSYQLLLDGVNSGAAIDGTGDLLDFGVQSSAGIYTVVAINSFCDSSTTMVGSVELGLAGTTTWTGTSWSNGVPTSSKAAIIAANYSENANITACSLTVNNNAIVTIPSGKSVTLNDAITVEAGSSFILSSNANLVQTGAINLNDGAITVNRNTSPLQRLDYVLWSSPVAGQNLLDFSSETLPNRFYIYNPTTNLYSSVPPASTDFAAATGYLIRMPDNHSTSPLAWAGAFVGEPNNGDYSKAVVVDSYNAVGNPYPTTISADLFITNNNLSEALYFWRKTNNSTKPSYATYTLAGGVGTDSNLEGGSNIEPNGTIQVGQGFIAKATTSTLNFTNAMKTNNHNDQFLRNASAEKNRIWLNMTGANGAFNQTMIAYMTGATQGIDAGIDGRFFNDSQTALNSLINGEEFAIQGRSLPFQASDVVPMQFKAAAAGTYTIAIDHLDGLFSGSQNIYLRDVVTGVEHDLKLSGYVFVSEAGTFANRFEVVYTNSLATNNPTLNANAVVIYKDNNQSFVINSGAIVMKSVKIFDIRGRLLNSKNNINASQITIDAGQSNEVLLVQVTSADGTTISKKVVR